MIRWRHCYYEAKYHQYLVNHVAAKYSGQSQREATGAPGPSSGARGSTSSVPDANGHPDPAKEQPKETYAEKVVKKRQAMQHAGIKLHVYLGRAAKNVSCALTNVELGGLVRKLKLSITPESGGGQVSHQYEGKY